MLFPQRLAVPEHHDVGESDVEIVGGRVALHAQVRVKVGYFRAVLARPVVVGLAAAHRIGDRGGRDGQHEVREA